jgi:UPF0716 protein FxsA
MGRVVLIGLILVPIIEIAIFIKVGQTIGLLWTLALVIGAGLVGAWLLRLQGLSVLNKARQSMETGRLPARTIADGMMIGLAGVLLVLPGLLSDLVAILLLLPPFRSWLYSRLARNVVPVDGAAPPPQRPDPRLGSTIDLDGGDWRER